MEDQRNVGGCRAGWSLGAERKPLDATTFRFRTPLARSICPQTAADDKRPRWWSPPLAAEHRTERGTTAGDDIPDNRWQRWRAPDRPALPAGDPSQRWR